MGGRVVLCFFPAASCSPSEELLLGYQEVASGLRNKRTTHNYASVSSIKSKCQKPLIPGLSG
jgi:hypothetical protein